MAPPPRVRCDFPETIVQFGTGAFLRGFIGDLVDRANCARAGVGAIVAIGSTESGREALLNAQDGVFTIAERGIVDGAVVNRRRVVQSISRALSATRDWEAILALARSPHVRTIVSNTTEVGIALDPADAMGDAPSRSFPAKLTQFLHERARAFAFDPAFGVVILPCELIERNGSELRAAVLELARRWELDSRFAKWLDAGTVFCDTLVDRIVSAPRGRQNGATDAEGLAYEDSLLTVCEPYLLFAIQGTPALRAQLPFPGTDGSVRVVDDITPFRTRKVRVLNGAHTLMAPIALQCGLETVREAILDKRIGGFVRRAIFDEIVPTLGVSDGPRYAAEVLERFANPFLEHRLLSLTLNLTAKMRVRVVPSLQAFMAARKEVPPSLTFGLAAFILHCRDDHLTTRVTGGEAGPADPDRPRIAAAWTSVDSDSASGLLALATTICNDEQLWRGDVRVLGGLAKEVANHLARAVTDGLPAALDAHMANLTPAAS